MEVKGNLMTERFAMSVDSYKRYKSMKTIGKKSIDIPMAIDSADMIVVSCTKEGISIEYNPRIKGFTITIK